jgi:hypothetical protein
MLCILQDPKSEPVFQRTRLVHIAKQARKIYRDGYFRQFVTGTADPTSRAGRKSPLMFRVTGSISTKSMVASQYSAQLVEASRLFGTVHIRTPGSAQSAKHPLCKAAIALATATASPPCESRQNALECGYPRTRRQELRPQSIYDRSDVSLLDVLATLRD